MIGISLCQYISSLNDCIVYAVCREGSIGLNKLPANKNIEVVFSDLENICNIASKINHADVFINLAWTNTDHVGRNNTALQGLNVDYAKEAIHVAGLMGCKLFVEAGSQAEYGYFPDLITEKTRCNPQTEYGKAKLRVLKEGSFLCNSLGIKYLHLRIFHIFGENDRPWTLIMAGIDKMLKNESLELSSCTQLWNYLYVSDCVKQIFLLCEYVLSKSDYKNGVYHIASKDTRPLKDYLEEMKSVVCSTSVLNYGSFIPSKQVSLNPSVTKTEEAIGFISEVSFAEALKLIINKTK